MSHVYVMIKCLSNGKKVNLSQTFCLTDMTTVNLGRICLFFPHADVFSVSDVHFCPTDGCSSHMTSVAVGALGGYLSYFLTEQDITKRPLS